MSEEMIRKHIADSIATKQRVLDKLVPLIKESGEVIVNALKSGNKVLVCGNGGSAADAQHLAAELIGRFETERIPLPGIALTTDTSTITAIGNDYGFDEVFARQVRALGNKGDVLIAISTSGSSKNILNAVEAAETKGMAVVCLSGKKGGLLAGLRDAKVLIVPADTTSRIQESHLLIYHIWCRMIDEAYR